MIAMKVGEIAEMVGYNTDMVKALAEQGTIEEKDARIIIQYIKHLKSLKETTCQ